MIAAQRLESKIQSEASLRGARRRGNLDRRDAESCMLMTGLSRKLKVTFYRSKSR
jgi:hypothetical protein